MLHIDNSLISKHSPFYFAMPGTPITAKPPEAEQRQSQADTDQKGRQEPKPGTKKRQFSGKLNMQ